MKTTNHWDKLNRLGAVASEVSGAPVAVHAYQYNLAGQRAAVTNVDNAFWVYSYDSLGQVTSGKKYFQDGTPVAGQQFEYAFDDIGNRKTAAAGGDAAGQNLRQQRYTANLLNQYTERRNPQSFGILGSANADATVTVWGPDGAHAQAIRQGEHFYGELAVSNYPGPVWLKTTNTAFMYVNDAEIWTNTTGKALVPPTPQVYTHDLDGNLTNDSVWSYTWDGENRLKSVESVSSLPADARRRVVFQYDYQGRRTEKIVSTNLSGTYYPAYTNRFIYDGWNLVAVLGSDLSPATSFAWGTDLSGTMQGAGGVGGLLSLTVHTGDNAGTYFCSFDGNGNVAGLVKASDGSVAARYEYGPFGEVIRATGPMAKANPFRFSTKYQDDESDLLYYGYRYEKDGRWLSRDPIEERGGLSLYGFAGNQPINKIDRDGRQTFPQRASFDVSIDTHHNYSEVIIGFRSGWKAQGCPDCKNIKLAQVVSTIYEGLWDNLTHSDGWKLDTDSSSDPWYPYQTSQYAYVSMHDAPGMRWYYPVPGDQIYGLTQIFETCAYCTDKGNRGFIGCVSWGHSVGGFRSSSNWGSGKNIPPLPPSETFLRAFDPDLFSPQAFN